MGGIAAYQVEIPELTGDHPALVVMQVDTDAGLHRQHGYPRKYRRTGVALAVGAVHDLLVTRQLNVTLALLHLDFLQADHVGIQLRHAFIEALLQHRAHAVDVPRDHFHENNTIPPETML